MNLLFKLGANVENLFLSTLNTYAADLEGSEDDNYLVGNAGINTIRGMGGDDLIEGGGGQDVLDGGDGNDRLNGGIGNDVLAGGAGNDVYLFSRGDGQDTVNNHDATAGDADTIRFGNGVAASDVTFNWNGNDLVLGIAGTSDQLTVLNWKVDAGYRIERVEFADGTAWDAAALNVLTGLNEVNVGHAPILVGNIANQSLLQGQALTLDVSGQFSDPDVANGDSLAYSATLADGSALPSWVTFDGATGIFGGTPGNGDTGMLSVTVTATDTGGLTAASAFNLEVVRLNASPIAVSDMFTVTENDSVSTLAVADLLANDTDPDIGDTLVMVGFDTHTAQGNAVTQDTNGNLVLDIGNNYQSLGAGQVAGDSFSYTITDAMGAISAASVEVSIAGINDAPEAVAPIIDQNALANAAFSYSGSSPFFAVNSPQ